MGNSIDFCIFEDSQAGKERVVVCDIGHIGYCCVGKKQNWLNQGRTVFSGHFDLGGTIGDQDH